MEGDELQPRELARTAATAAIDKKAKDVLMLDVAPLTVVTDFFVICSAGSTTQVRAIADGVEEKLKLDGLRPLHVEGYDKSTWILLDYNSVVVHVFLDREREFYNLERLWGDADSVEI
jgi:ribosome-associated protein